MCIKEGLVQGSGSDNHTGVEGSAQLNGTYFRAGNTTKGEQKLLETNDRERSYRRES